MNPVLSWRTNDMFTLNSLLFQLLPEVELFELCRYVVQSTLALRSLFNAFSVQRTACSATPRNTIEKKRKLAKKTRCNRCDKRRQAVEEQRHQVVLYRQKPPSPSLCFTFYRTLAASLANFRDFMRQCLNSVFFNQCAVANQRTVREMSGVPFKKLFNFTKLV